MKRWQTKKFKESSKLLFFKNLTFIDVSVFIVIFIVSSLISFYGLGEINKFIKLGVFAGITLLCSFVLIKSPKHGVRYYVVLWRLIVYLTSKKKYNKSTISALIPYRLVKNKDYIANKEGSTVFSVLQIFGKDITQESAKEQEIYFKKLTELLNKVETKISIVKLPRKSDLKTNLEDLQQKHSQNNNQNLNQLFEEYKEAINTANTETTVDTYFIVVYAESENDLYSEIQKLKNELTNCKLRYKQLNQDQIIALLNEIFVYDENFSIEQIANNNNLLSFKNLNFKKDHFVIDGNYYSVQTIMEFPSLLNNNYVQKTFDSPSVIIWNLSKIPSDELAKLVHKNYISSHLNISEQKNKLLNSKKQNDIAAQEELSEIASLENENVFKSSIMMLSKATNKHYLDKIKSINLKNLKSWNAKIDNLIYRQYEALGNVFFRSKDILKEHHEQVASNIAYAWPFLYEEYNDKNFFLVGINSFNQKPVFINQKLKTMNRTNHNMFILGETGAGKSSFTQKLILDKLAQGDQVFIIDPQGEYTDFVKKLGGISLNLGANGESKINPLQIRHLFNPDFSSESKDTPLTMSNSDLLHLHEDFFKQWICTLYPRLTDKDTVFIIAALHKVYKKWNFINSNEDIANLPANKYPLMKDLIDALYEQLGEYEQNEKISDLQIKEWYLLLEIIKTDFIDGKYAERYNSYSTMKLDEQIISFNVSSLMNQESTTFNSSFYLFLSYIKGKISQQHHKDNMIWIVIDEAHKFIDSKKEITLDFIYSTIKEIRKYKGGVIITTQNPEDFAKTENLKEQGKAIMSACQYAVLFRLKAAQIQIMNIFFSLENGLSKNEENSILAAHRGQCLYKLSPDEKVFITVNYSQTEKDLIWKEKTLITQTN